MKFPAGQADRLTRDPLRYMKNPGKVVSDQYKYDSNTATDSRNRIQDQKSVSADEPTKEVCSSEENCFEEQRLHAHYYKLVSSDIDFNLLRQVGNDESDNSSQMDVEESMMVDESCSEMDTEDDAKMTILQPNKSSLKSSVRKGKIADTAMEEEYVVGAVNPRRVLFGANTSLVFNNNASVDTSTASSQFNGSFIRAEETINTKLANAEISMMFSSPHANASFATGDDGCTLKGLNFSICHDDPNQSADDERCGMNSITYSVTNGLSFAIHNDDKKCDSFRPVRPRVDASGNYGEDTASLSIIGNVLDNLGSENSVVNFTSDARSTSKPIISKPIDDRSGARGSKVSSKAGEETADLALIHGVMGSLNNCSVSRPPSSKFVDENQCRPPSKGPAAFKIFVEDAEGSIKGAPTNSTQMGFEIFSDDNNLSSHQKKNALPDLSFGDISRIEDEKTSNFQIFDESAVIISSEKCDAIVYERRHKQDLESAMRECLVAAAKSTSQSSIFDYRRKAMPKALLRQSFTAGTKIDLGRDTVTIANELGRGVYGVVLLCNDEMGQSDALKVQAPIGSLAHEYSLLLRVEDRIEPNASSDFYPFPRSLALYAFSEGGLFSMTAGSDSGMNLIDVVNTYKKITGNVPELLAMYYTSRMLKHLESLHQHGKVLVSSCI